MFEVSIVLIGSVLFLGAMVRFRSVYLISSASGNKKFRIRWLLLGLTVVGFFIGYLLFISHLLASLDRTPSDRLVSIIFFGGSVFVFVCANLFYSTTSNLVNLLQENILQKKKLDQQSRGLKNSIDRKTLELAREKARLAEVTTRGERFDKERLKARTMASQRLESAELLASGIAHDFNNLLVGILGNASYAKQLRPDEVEGLEEALGEIEEAADRAAELTNHLSFCFGKNQNPLEAINLSELSNEVLSILRTSIDIRITVVRDWKKDLPLVWGDSTRFRQLMVNLVINGCEAILPSSGLLTIRTGIVELGEESATSGQFRDSLQPGAYVYFEVEDQGCGIPDSERFQVFEPFFSTKGLGRGLGLTAAERIVRSHAGGLTLSSTEGEGTKVRAVFPIFRDEADQDPKPRDAKGATAQKGRILVVDDELIVLDTIQRGLERRGFSVDVVSRDSEFLNVMSEPKVVYSAAIVEMMMSSIAFDEAFEVLRSRFPKIPILLSSGYSDIDTDGIFGDDALVRFLAKPYSVDALLEAIAALEGDLR